MSRIRSSRVGSFPSAKGSAARLAFQRATEAGIDTQSLLKKAGLTAQQLKNPDSRIAVAGQIKFLNLVAEALDDDCLGFRLAQLPDLRELGMIYYVLASSELLIDALRRGARYSSIVNEGAVQSLRENNLVTVALHYVGVDRHLDRHQIEFWMAIIVRLCRQLTGLRLLPVHVRMSHHRDTRLAEFNEFFGSDVEFGAKVDEIVFEKKSSQLPLVGADPYLNRLLVGYCEETLSRQGRGRGSFQSSVANAVAPLLPHGKARARDIARGLGLSPRTLARRLASEGLTFSSLVQDLRSDLAQRYLADHKLSISQIAWLLGYREVGAFSHAFKRRTGKTPREARAPLTRRDRR